MKDLAERLFMMATDPEMKDEYKLKLMAIEIEMCFLKEKSKWLEEKHNEKLQLIEDCFKMKRQ
jgi:hypothetical protein